MHKQPTPNIKSVQGISSQFSVIAESLALGPSHRHQGVHQALSPIVSMPFYCSIPIKEQEEVGLSILLVQLKKKEEHSEVTSHVVTYHRPSSSSQQHCILPSSRLSRGWSGEVACSIEMDPRSPSLPALRSEVMSSSMQNPTSPRVGRDVGFCILPLLSWLALALPTDFRACTVTSLPILGGAFQHHTSLFLISIHWDWWMTGRCVAVTRSLGGGKSTHVRGNLRAFLPLL